MPELVQECTPAPAPPPPPPGRRPPMPPPSPPPRDWERLEGFRFTFLHLFALEDAEVLRSVAQLLYGLILETPAERPDLPGPWTRRELIAAAGELRFIHDYLMSIFREHEVSSLPPEVEKLSKLAGGVACDLLRVIEWLEGELRAWHRKHGSR